jgi:hypothetical protein
LQQKPPRNGDVGEMCTRGALAEMAQTPSNSPRGSLPAPYACPAYSAGMGKGRTLLLPIGTQIKRILVPNDLKADFPSRHCVIHADCLAERREPVVFPELLSRLPETVWRQAPNTQSLSSTNGDTKSQALQEKRHFSLAEPAPASRREFFNVSFSQA